MKQNNKQANKNHVAKLLMQKQKPEEQSVKQDQSQIAALQKQQEINGHVNKIFTILWPQYLQNNSWDLGSGLISKKQKDAEYRKLVKFMRNAAQNDFQGGAVAVQEKYGLSIEIFKETKYFLNSAKEDQLFELIAVFIEKNQGVHLAEPEQKQQIGVDMMLQDLASDAQALSKDKKKKKKKPKEEEKQPAKMSVYAQCGDKSHVNNIDDIEKFVLEIWQILRFDNFSNPFLLDRYKQNIKELKSMRASMSKIGGTDVTNDDLKLVKNKIQGLKKKSSICEIDLHGKDGYLKFESLKLWENSRDNPKWSYVLALLDEVCQYAPQQPLPIQKEFSADELLEMLTPGGEEEAKDNEYPIQQNPLWQNKIESLLKLKAEPQNIGAIDAPEDVDPQELDEFRESIILAKNNYDQKKAELIAIKKDQAALKKKLMEARQTLAAQVQEYQNAMNIQEKHFEKEINLLTQNFEQNQEMDFSLFWQALKITLQNKIAVKSNIDKELEQSNAYKMQLDAILIAENKIKEEWQDLIGEAWDSDEQEM
jgi:hypothetical protein